MIAANVIQAAHEASFERPVFLGSTCIYPKLTPQPIPEEALLTGPLEESNEWYAIAKIAGLKLTQACLRTLKTSDYLGLGTWSESSSVQALKIAIIDDILLSLKA